MTEEERKQNVRAMPSAKLLASPCWTIELLDDEVIDEVMSIHRDSIGRKIIAAQAKERAKRHEHENGRTFDEELRKTERHSGTDSTPSPLKGQKKEELDN